MIWSIFIFLLIKFPKCLFSYCRIIFAWNNYSAKVIIWGEQAHGKAPHRLFSFFNIKHKRPERVHVKGVWYSVSWWLISCQNWPTTVNLSYFVDCEDFWIDCWPILATLHMLWMDAGWLSRSYHLSDKKHIKLCRLCIAFSWHCKFVHSPSAPMPHHYLCLIKLYLNIFVAMAVATDKCNWFQQNQYI